MKDNLAFTPLTGSDDIIATAQSNYELCMKWATYWKSLMDAALNAPDQKINTNKKEKSIVKKKIDLSNHTVSSHGQLRISLATRKKKNGFPTIEQVVLEALSDGFPKKTRDLMQSYEKVTGKKYIRKNFASNLLAIAKNKNSIRNQHFPGLGNGENYWWGKSDWFNNDKMKTEYKDKVLEMVST